MFKGTIDKRGRRQTAPALGPVGPLVSHFGLIRVMAWSEIRSRYARSILGLAWLVLMPIFFVAVFMFVRVYVFGFSVRSEEWLGAHLGVSDTMMLGFMLFLGFIVFWTAQETISRAPAAIIGNANLVDSGAFPVEALPWIVVAVATVNFSVRFVLFTAVFIAISGTIHPTMVLLPIVLAPLGLVLLGLCFVLAAITPYLRDIELLLASVMTGLLILSGVLFPISAVSPEAQIAMTLNPIAMTIDQARDVFILGRPPDWPYLAKLTVVGLVSAWGGYFVFRSLKKGFADVL